MAGFLNEEAKKRLVSNSEIDSFIAEGEINIPFAEKVTGTIKDGTMEYTAFGILLAVGDAAIKRFYDDKFRTRAAQLREVKDGKIYIRDERFG